MKNYLAKFRVLSFPVSASAGGLNDDHVAWADVEASVSVQLPQFAGPAQPVLPRLSRLAAVDTVGPGRPAPGCERPRSG